MPRFKTLDPQDVFIGRGAAAQRERVPYVKHIQDADAGEIRLDGEDRPTVVRRRLREAARELGVKVRASWQDAEHTVLRWKRTQATMQ